MKIPLPSGRGGHPTITPVFGSRVNRESVGPSCRSNAGSTLSPVGSSGSRILFEFSSMPVPSSNSVTENVLDAPAKLTAPLKLGAPPVQASFPNSGTLIHLTLNALMFANPKACTGNVPQLTARADGFKSVHAGAIRGGPTRKSGTFAEFAVEPTPNVTFPLELMNNPFHTQLATGPPNTNSNPPDSGPGTGGLPAPLSSSPRNG